MKKITFLIFLTTAFTVPDLAAQQAVTASGGEISGSGGTASLSSGQIVYTVISGSGGTATQGVQQPFEISVIGKDEQKSISLKTTVPVNAIVSPNPTVATISLFIEHEDLSNFRYELYDLNGRIISNNRIREKETIITMEKYPSGMYILKIYDGMHQIKNFKIIKKDI
ncbi:T9SS type A sorting domain-containing protein [Flavobacterium suzhouense]|uniref:T9SS type A sorting domain-containing protein n=1 Tax=Flavobacterium suzhouense TaxID=1529638 RepID=A0ABW5NVF3_9FLAO